MYLNFFLLRFAIKEYVEAKLEMTGITKGVFFFDPIRTVTMRMGHFKCNVSYINFALTTNVFPKIKQNKTKQNKTKQNKTKQNKTKQNKTK